MGAPFVSVDVVCKGEDGLAVGVVVLHGHFYDDVLFSRFKVDRFRMKHILVLVQMVHKGANSPFVNKGRFAVRPKVFQDDFQPPVEKRKFPQALGDGFVAELESLEDLFVGLESDFGPSSLRRAQLSEFRNRLSPFVALLVDFTRAPNLQIKPPAQSIHDGDTYPVQPAGDLIGIVVELTPGVQGGHHDLGGGFLGLLVKIGRDSPSVVYDRDAVVDMDGNFDTSAKSVQRLVDGVVHNFVQQVMQPIRRPGSDVHRRS